MEPGNLGIPHKQSGETMFTLPPIIKESKEFVRKAAKWKKTFLFQAQKLVKYITAQRLQDTCKH